MVKTAVGFLCGALIGGLIVWKVSASGPDARKGSGESGQFENRSNGT